MRSIPLKGAVLNRDQEGGAHQRGDIPEAKPMPPTRDVVFIEAAQSPASNAPLTIMVKHRRDGALVHRRQGMPRKAQEGEGVLIRDPNPGMASMPMGGTRERGPPSERKGGGKVLERR